jgi:LacI family transcriptional regulator, galactose operon repressor
MDKRPTIVDIAKALGVSTATVHRALHDHPNTTPLTKTRVLQMAKKMGYRPNLAARYLSSKKALRVAVNTLKGTTSFWDEVRNGVEDERRSLGLENVQIDFNTFPQLGEGEDAAFETALDQGVDGIIMFPSHPKDIRSLMRRAARAKIPVVFAVTDAPGSGRLSVVSIDTKASGNLAADLMGRVLRGQGKVAVTMSEMGISEHAEKYRAFAATMRRFYPNIVVQEPVEDYDIESTAYDRSVALMKANPDLSGIYVTTEASIPVIAAARDLRMLDRLTIVTTDLFPTLVKEITAGTVTATIYQRPRTQGRMAFRMLHEFLVEGECPPPQLRLAPHLVMRGNLEFFMQRANIRPASNGERAEVSPDDLPQVSTR